MSLQDEIDSISYPPTHTYELNGLVPKSALADRVEVIKREFSNFFRGTLLDVGCNKGFFSLYNKGPVVGIDPSEECVKLCRKLRPDGEFHVTTFEEYTTDKVFDKIFVGNGHHYPFIGAGGWSWIEKFANLSNGFVLLEGPTGMESKDAQNCIPQHLTGEFTQEKLIEAFDPLFILRALVPSPLVDRYFLLFEKRDSDYIYRLYLESVYRLAAEYASPDDIVMEICTRHDRGVLSRRIIPHKEFLMVDKSHNRQGLSLDAVIDTLPTCHVAISTAVFHHTAPTEIDALFNNIAKNTLRTIIISGPADDVGVPLYGDHLYHLNVEELGQIAQRAGWTMASKRVGIKHCTPYEWFLVFTRGGRT